MLRGLVRPLLLFVAFLLLLWVRCSVSSSLSCCCVRLVSFPSLGRCSLAFSPAFPSSWPSVRVGAGAWKRRNWHHNANCSDVCNTSSSIAQGKAQLLIIIVVLLLSRGVPSLCGAFLMGLTYLPTYLPSFSSAKSPAIRSSRMRPCEGNANTLALVACAFYNDCPLQELNLPFHVSTTKAETK